MRARRFVASLAEWSLAAGRPLDGELKWAAQQVPELRPRLADATRHLESGSLAAGLDCLTGAGLDPLVARAGTLCPAAARDVSDRLRKLPTRFQLALETRKILVYLFIVFGLQLSVGAVLLRTVLSTFLNMAGELGASDPFAFASFAVRASRWSELLVVAAFTGPAMGLVLRSAYRHLERSRALAAAAALAGRVPPAQIATVLASPSLGGERQVEKAKAEDWDALATLHRSQAEAVSVRRSRLVASVGGVAALAYASALVITVHTVISRLSSLVTP